MSIFEYVTVAISIVLGLGVAQLLSGALELVRYRKVARIHWVPMLWALAIFAIQLEFWWSLFRLSGRPEVWSHQNFLLAIGTALSLSAAGSLILPQRWPEGGLDLLEYFNQDGKMGVAAFALFNVLAFPLNVRLFGLSLMSATTMYILGMLGAQVGVLVSRSSRLVGVFTVLFLILQTAVLL